MICDLCKCAVAAQVPQCTLGYRYVPVRFLYSGVLVRNPYPRSYCLGHPVFPPKQHAPRGAPGAPLCTTQSAGHFPSSPHRVQALPLFLTLPFLSPSPKRMARRAQEASSPPLRSRPTLTGTTPVFVGRFPRCFGIALCSPFLSSLS